MSKKAGFDPLEFGKKIERLVVREGIEGQERKYLKAPSINPMNKNLKFRVSNYYRGTAVVDVVGCNLRCVFCWAKDNIWTHPAKVGEFYSPRSIAHGLIDTARTTGYKYLRMTQGEPTLSKDHLITVLQELEHYTYPFLLETNGIILGDDAKFVKELSNYKNLHIRISLKGATAEKFRLLTGAKETFYDLQLKALKNCLDNQISCHPAIMLDLIGIEDEFERLQSSLCDIDPDLIKVLEFERLFLYPHVKQRLDRNKVEYKKRLNS